MLALNWITVGNAGSVTSDFYISCLHFVQKILIAHSTRFLWLRSFLCIFCFDYSVLHFRTFGQPMCWFQFIFRCCFKMKYDSSSWILTISVYLFQVRVNYKPTISDSTGTVRYSSKHIAWERKVLHNIWFHFTYSVYYPYFSKGIQLFSSATTENATLQTLTPKILFNFNHSANFSIRFKHFSKVHLFKTMHDYHSKRLAENPLSRLDRKLPRLLCIWLEYNLHTRTAFEFGCSKRKNEISELILQYFLNETFWWILKS